MSESIGGFALTGVADFSQAKAELSAFGPSLAKQLDTWKRQADTIGMSAVELAQYNVAVKGGTANQIELAGALARVVELKKQISTVAEAGQPVSDEARQELQLLQEKVGLLNKIERQSVPQAEAPDVRQRREAVKKLNDEIQRQNELLSARERGSQLGDTDMGKLLDLKGVGADDETMQAAAANLQALHERRQALKENEQAEHDAGAALDQRVHGIDNLVQGLESENRGLTLNRRELDHYRLDSLGASEAHHRWVDQLHEANDAARLAAERKRIANSVGRELMTGQQYLIERTRQLKIAFQEGSIGIVQYTQALDRAKLTASQMELGLHGASRRGQIVQQLAFGVEDFAVSASTGGFAAGFRGALNNITFAASMVGGAIGLWTVGIGTAIIAATSLWKAFKASREETGEIAENLKKAASQKFITDFGTPFSQARSRREQELEFSESVTDTESYAIEAHKLYKRKRLAEIRADAAKAEMNELGKQLWWLRESPDDTRVKGTQFGIPGETTVGELKKRYADLSEEVKKQQKEAADARREEGVLKEFYGKAQAGDKAKEEQAATKKRQQEDERHTQEMIREGTREGEAAAGRIAAREKRKYDEILGAAGGDEPRLNRQVRMIAEQEKRERQIRADFADEPELRDSVLAASKSRFLAEFETTLEKPSQHRNAAVLANTSEAFQLSKDAYREAQGERNVQQQMLTELKKANDKFEEMRHALEKLKSVGAEEI
jgi:hypothetical protein